MFYEMAGTSPSRKPDARTSGYLPNLVVVPGMLLIGAGAAAMILPIIMFLAVMVPSMLLTGAMVVTLTSAIVLPLTKVATARGLVMCSLGAAIVIPIAVKFSSST